jgi:hypothetical protein
MNDRIARQHLRINVLRADQVGVWHCMLKLALELDKPGAPLRSVALGCFDYVCADGRTGTFTPELMAQVFALPLAVVASTIDTLLELQILTREGTSLRIENAADWFIPSTEHPSLRN